MRRFGLVAYRLGREAARARANAFGVSRGWLWLTLVAAVLIFAVGTFDGIDARDVFAAGTAASSSMSAVHAQSRTAAAQAASVSVFTVNSSADTDDGSCDPLGQGTGNQDCTLREAINAANAHPNASTAETDRDQIGFAIPSNDPGFNGQWATITVQTNLPADHRSGRDRR